MIAEILIVVGVLGVIVAGTVILSEIYDLSHKEEVVLSKTLSDLYKESMRNQFKYQQSMSQKMIEYDRMRAKWKITRRHKTRSPHRKFVKVKR